MGGHKLRNDIDIGSNWDVADSRTVTRNLRRKGICVRKASLTDLQRMSIQREQVISFNDDLTALLTKHKYLQKLVFNADETAVWGRQDSSDLKVLCGRELGSARRIFRPPVGHVTALVCVSVYGSFAPTMVIRPLVCITVEEARVIKDDVFIPSISPSTTLGASPSRSLKHGLNGRSYRL